MPPGPDPAGPWRDEDPAGEPGGPVPAPDADSDWLAWCEAAAQSPEPDEEEPDTAAPWEWDLDAIITECRRVTAEEAAAAARAAGRGLPGGRAVPLARRGPGQPGSARLAPGEYLSRAAGFGAGMALDIMPGCGALAGFAAEAAGDDDRYAGAGDDEVAGAISAWDRVEAYACARKHAAAAEWIRRRPAPGCAPQGPAQLPAAWDEFAVTELAALLAESRGTAEGMLELAGDLAGKLPGTMAAFLDGIVSKYKVQIIAAAAALLDPAEARAAEALVLGRAGRLTPGGLRAAIARAVMQVTPEKARKRREAAARDARVQRWAEDSGNAALMGRELPPAEVLAADERITARARQLKAAGLEGDMDVLRARAYLDLLLGQDSRRRQDPADGQDPGGQDPGGGHDGTGPGGPRGGPDPGGPGAGAAPAGFAGRVTLTVPLTTVQDQAERPGEIPGIGPVDPALARDLAASAAQNPSTTWCVTVTDQDGHAIGHGCARPEPKSHRKRAGDLGRRAGPGSPSPLPARTGRRAGTAPGGCVPREAGRTCWLPWTRFPSATATTGSRPGAMTPGSSCDT